AALKSVARAITERIRKTDLAARIGGDEFAVFLPGVSSTDAETVATVLLAAIRKESRQIGPDGEGVTSSLGIALFSPNDDIDVAGLMDAADSAMYAAKRSGGNRFRVGDLVELGDAVHGRAERTT
ncbi:MAG: GGDEF domain-containing protein, partial [Actinomycetota bacterium]|nr:GGDEF domain-containing protein [Actinomycetota bacterium]